MEDFIAPEQVFEAGIRTGISITIHECKSRILFYSSLSQEDCVDILDEVLFDLISEHMEV